MLLGAFGIWRRFPGSAGVERASMRTGRKELWFRHRNGTVVTGFPTVERWSCGRSLPTVTGCMETGLSACRINPAMEDTTARRPERCVHGCCNPYGGGLIFYHVIMFLCYSEIGSTKPAGGLKTFHSMSLLTVGSHCRDTWTGHMLPSSVISCHLPGNIWNIGWKGFILAA